MWKKVREAAAGLEVEGSLRIHIEYQDPSGEMKSLEISREFLVCQRLERGDQLVRSTADEGHVDWVRNPRYWFEATQKPNVDKPFFSGGAEHAAEIPRSMPLGAQEYANRLDTGNRIWTFTLEELLNSSEFRLVAANWIEANQTRLARVEFEFLGSRRDGPKFPGGRYWGELDPENHWQIVRCGVQVPEENLIYEVQNTFQLTPDGLPFPKQIRQLRMISGAPDRDESIYEFSAPRECARPSEAFTLAGYGFSESLVQVRSSRAYLRLVLLNLGIVGLILSIVLYRYFRRRRQRTAE